MQITTAVLLLNSGALALLSPRWPKHVPVSQFTRDRLFELGLETRQENCDGQICADVCIPADATCCDVTVGIYCEAGETCTTSDTCCPDGQSCGGGRPSAETCDDNEKVCGGGCISKDNECCDMILGSFCENGNPCLSSATCDLTGGNSNDNGKDNGKDSSSKNDGNNKDNNGDNSDGSSYGDDSNGKNDKGSSSGSDNSSSNNDTKDGNDKNSSSDSSSKNEEDAASIAHPSLMVLAVAAVFALL